MHGEVEHGDWPVTVLHEKVDAFGLDGDLEHGAEIDFGLSLGVVFFQVLN